MLYLREASLTTRTATDFDASHGRWPVWRRTASRRVLLQIVRRHFIPGPRSGGQSNWISLGRTDERPQRRHRLPAAHRHVVATIWIAVEVCLRPFRGNFEKQLMSMGVIVEHCPPESRFLIGMVERRNALLWISIEKLIDQFSTLTLAEVPVTLIQACHAMNSLAFTRGRSAYQAVFGRLPRLPDDVLTDGQVLSTSTQPHRDPELPALRAELVRSEAMKALLDINAQQQFRRALLRKTRNTRVPDLQPGQRCAVWRWNKRGLRKRGAWLTARFLSWDPSYPGQQAWIRLGATTTLATAEQVRAAHSFEDWCPDEQDIKALRDASNKFEEHLLEDDRGPGPADEEATQDAPCSNTSRSHHQHQ